MTRSLSLLWITILFLIILFFLLAGDSSFPKREASVAQSEPVYYSDQVAVLMYHHLETETTPGLSSLAVRDFQKQMHLLKENGFHVISMEQYARYMMESAPVPDNAVLLTFDDGYESFYSHAYPILRKYHYPATNFVIVSSIDDRNRQGIPKLTWEQMREMQKSGMSFYNHTFDSHRYGRIDSSGHKGTVLSHPLYLEDHGRMETTTEYIRRVSNDLEAAERRLREELSNEMGIIAFPYGQYDQEHTLKIMQKLDIELAFTIQPGINTRSDRFGRRINAGGGDQSPEQLIAQLKALNDPSFSTE